MKAVLKFDLLIATFILMNLFIILSAIVAWADGKKDKQENCGENAFTTEIVSFEENGSCYDVVLNVSFNEGVNFELSHANFDFGCGTYSDAQNSEGWPMALNEKDPTTGYGGIKVDDIQNFGKDWNLSEFQVTFRYCPGTDCDISALDIAYKAGQCIYDEQITVSVSDDDDDGTGDNGNDDNGDNDNGTGDDTTDNNTGDCNNDPDNPNGGSGSTPAELVVNVDKINPTCLNENGGAINLSVSGGAAPIEIMWSTGDMTSTLNNLPEGTYSYTVTDALGNKSAADVILDGTSNIIVETILTKPGCQGKNNGAIELVVSGGAEPYTFLWNNGSTDQNLSGLFAYTYQVTVTDANGCSSDLFIPLFNDTNILVNADVVHPSCQDDRLGSIALSPSGGAAPYSYSWSDGQTTSSLTELIEGKYEVDITDQNGCTYSSSYSLSTEVGIEVTAAVTKTNCFDEAIGAIDLTVSGGNKPYQIVWSNEAEGDQIDGLTSGDYTATITDSKGCETTYRASVLKNDINIGYEGINIPACEGSNDGSIGISVTNGTEPYKIDWIDAETGLSISSEPTISNLSAGTYKVSVIDNEGCTADKTIQLPQPSSIQIAHEIVTDECSGKTDIVLNASGGSWEYSYLWFDGSTDDKLSVTAPGIYSVTVTDSKQCGASKDIVVDNIQVQELACLIEDPAADISCGSASNILSSTVDGAISYRWAVSSSDGGWSITSSTDQSQIQYTAGTAGSQATITLTVAYEGGCEVSCQQVIGACIQDQNPDDNCCCDQNEDESTEDGPVVDDVGSETENEGIECSECEGGVTYLTLDYLGEGPVSIVATGEIKGQKGNKEKNGWEQVFTSVNNGDILEIQTPGGAEKLGTRTYLTVDDGEPFEIHTSCSQDIAVGMVFGDYEVVEGASLKGGPFCEVVPSDDDIAHDGTNGEGSENEDCNTCEGGVTYLTLDYLGDGPVSIMATGEIKGQKGEKGKKEKSGWEQIFTGVNNGDIIEIQTPGGAEKLGTRTYLTIDDGEPFEIHTSCSQDIAVGMVFGDYKVVEGASLKGGSFCEVASSDDDFAYDGSNDEGNDEEEDDSEDGEEEQSEDEASIVDKDCDCFYTNPVQITKTADGYNYSIEVMYDDCSYALSHLTIDIPDCYQVTDYSNSMSWAMDLVSNDPTTGLSGLKIDGISSFGKDENLSSFTIDFSLTADDSECQEELRCFAPVIAYKASTCVYEEFTQSECIPEEVLAETISTYPNPTTDYVKINMKNCDKSKSYKADVFDFSGEKVCSYFIDKGFKDEFVVDLKFKKHGLYLLQLTRKDGVRSTHKIVKL